MSGACQLAGGHNAGGEDDGTCQHNGEGQCTFNVFGRKWMNLLYTDFNCFSESCFRICNWH